MSPEGMQPAHEGLMRRGVAMKYWLEMMESGIEAATVFFVCFCFLFLTVPHKALIEKLPAIGLVVYLVQWITEHLTNRVL